MWALQIPGRTGNVVLSAHNDVYGEIFRYLDKLAPGDQVVLYTQQRQYVYVVDRTAVGRANCGGSDGIHGKPNGDVDLVLSISC